MAERDQSPTRRSVAVAGRGWCAVIASGAASAQPAPAARVKGPLVWLDMDQKELDDAYDQAVYAPNRDSVIKRASRNSELRARASARRSASPMVRRRSRGSTSSRTKTPNAPINIYHPRRRLARRHSPRTSRFLAEMFVNAGAHFVVLDFTNVIDAGGRPAADGRSGAPRGRLGLQERRELRRRSRAASTSPAIPPAAIWSACC